MSVGIGDLIGTGGVLGFVGVLGKLAIDWVRSRRRERARDDVAEGSVKPTLAERNLSVLDAQIVLLEKANASERASYERRILALESDVGRLTGERDSLLNSVATLRQQMGELYERLDAMASELDALQSRPH